MVLRAYRTGGWPAVDRMLRLPPTSTAALLHPDRPAPGPPITDAVMPAAPRGTEEILTDALGEWTLATWLARRLPAERAEALAAGWDADRLRIVRLRADRDRWSMAWRVRCRTVAMRQALEPSCSRISARWWLACRAEAAARSWRGPGPVRTSTSVSTGPERQLTARQLKVFPRTPHPKDPRPTRHPRTNREQVRIFPTARPTSRGSCSAVDPTNGVGEAVRCRLVSTRVAPLITTGGRGTSSGNGPPEPVGTLAIASTTSIPSTTLPNTQ